MLRGIVLTLLTFLTYSDTCQLSVLYIDQHLMHQKNVRRSGSFSPPVGLGLGLGLALGWGKTPGAPECANIINQALFLGVFWSVLF